MRTVRRIGNVAILSIIAAGLGLGCCSAQRTNCETGIAFKGEAGLTLTTLLQRFSQEQDTSVLAEISDEPKTIDVLQGTYSLAELSRKFGPALHCESVGKVLHVFDDSVLSAGENALNYQFASFRIPSNLEEFQTILEERLTHEAFAPAHENKTLIQSLGGGITGNADAYPLQTETVRNVQARTLIISVASRYTLSSVICFPKPKTESKYLDTWKTAAAHWYWKMSGKTVVAQ